MQGATQICLPWWAILIVDHLELMPYWRSLFKSSLKSTSFSKKVLTKINKLLVSTTANTKHNIICYVQTSGISEFTDGKDAGLENLEYF